VIGLCGPYWRRIPNQCAIGAAHDQPINDQLELCLEIIRHATPALFKPIIHQLFARALLDHSAVHKKLPIRGADGINFIGFQRENFPPSGGQADFGGMNARAVGLVFIKRDKHIDGVFAIGADILIVQVITCPKRFFNVGRQDCSKS